MKTRSLDLCHWINLSVWLFSFPYNKHDPNPKKNYGIHGVNLAFYLHGSKGVIQFILYTNWQLPHVTEERKDKSWTPINVERPQPADLGYHSPIANYKDQSRQDHCDLLKQQYCYYDGSSLNAYNIYDILLKEGDEGVWRALEKYYQDVFVSDY